MLLNDTQFFEASRVFAERIISQSKNDLSDSNYTGFRLATSRFPKESEVKLLKELYLNKLSFYKKKR